MPNDPEMLEEYDFSKAIQGKYSKKYAEGTNIVVIEPDVVKYFPDHDSVNEALRSLIEILKRQKHLA
jgi:transcription elongation factor GreA-like protein